MQGKCVSDAQVKALCLVLGLEISKEQKRRVARGHALFLANCVKKLYQCPEYEFWICSSQTGQGIYFIWLSSQAICCNCPDAQKGYVCKHSIATLLKRRMQGSLSP